ncbi:uncharacterized protein LOC134831102 [Culicoides brevitarsis]|uniref:uncharacterized protein LOC134831102 n=1 Tax=Culicoides brevitarsis TaxID=469753 RepID=UPI00307BEA49
MTDGNTSSNSSKQEEKSSSNSSNSVVTPNNEPTEEAEVSVNFLDRVIKHALNNTLPIGNFDSTKPFDLVNRRPGGLPNFNHQPMASSSTVTSSSTTTTTTVGGENSSCDNDSKKESDLKGVIVKKSDENMSSSASPKRETSENSVVVVNNQKSCDAEHSSSSSNNVQQPVVTSSMHHSTAPSVVIQATSQMSNNEPTNLTMQDGSKTETRQEIIDKKYKTKEDLKNARIMASRLESSHESINLSLPPSSSSSPSVSGSKSLSLYVSAPDFSKKIFTAPEISTVKPHHSNPLHVRPPDFNRAASQTKELQIPNPVFKLKGGDESHLYSNSSAKSYHRSTSVPMTQEQLAELSKTHNYIPDLRLKSPTVVPIPVIHPPPNQNKAVEEEPLPHVIHKAKYHESMPETCITPVLRIAEHSKIAEPPSRHVDPKVHYPPYKPKHMIDPQSSQPPFKQMRVEDHKKVPYDQKYPLPHPSTTTTTTDKHYMYKMEEPKFGLTIEQQQQKDHEFSLKEKERQLRQEGTIITVKASNDVKMLPSHHVPNNYHQMPPHQSRPVEPAKLTKENVDRHLREIKHLYPPGHPALTTLAKDMPLMMKPRAIPEQPKHESHEKARSSSGHYQPYNEKPSGSYQKHPSGYPQMYPSGKSEISYYPHPSVSPHGQMRSTTPHAPAPGQMNPPVNWPNQRMAPSPHATNVSPSMPQVPSPVFVHPSSKHSPSPTQFSRPPVAQSPNKSVSPQLTPQQQQYRQVSYSPVHMQQHQQQHSQQKPPSVDDKYRDRRVVASSPTMQRPQVVVYETGSGPRRYPSEEKSPQLRPDQYPGMKYAQGPPPHELRHAASHESLNRNQREYEMHKYAQYGPEMRRSESDLTGRPAYPNDVPMHKRDDYRSHSLDRAAYERQKEYEYRSRSRMPSSSPTESYKIQLDISAAIKHETNRNESPSRHDPYHHQGSSSRATMEVQSSPSPSSHYQASILIRPSPSTSNSRMEQPPSQPHIKTEPSYAPPPKEIRQEPPPPTVIATPQHVVQARPSVVAPLVKRESPLDLSVKTVKTKADSTGSEQQMYRRVDDRYVLPKVEFHPNFVQHQQRPPVNERERSQFEPQSHPSQHVPVLAVPHQQQSQHPMPSSSGVPHRIPVPQAPYDQSNHKNIPSHHPGMQRIPPEAPNNAKYYDQRHRLPEVAIKGPPHDERTIHIEVGEPYRPDLPPHKQPLHRQESLHVRHATYPATEQRAGTSYKPIPIPQARGSVINNSAAHDPQRLEDRKYVESILYKKQPPPSAIANAEITFRYIQDNKHAPRPLSPRDRKRPLEYEASQIPQKQIRYEPQQREMPQHPSHHPSSYPERYVPAEKIYPRESAVEIHAHKMIYERYPPTDARSLQQSNHYPKHEAHNEAPRHPHHMYPDPRQPESKSHPGVVKTIPKDSFRHDPKDEPRAGFPPPQQHPHVKYPPQQFFPRPPMNEVEGLPQQQQQKQTAVTWHPSAPHPPPLQSASSSRVIVPTPFDIRNQYNERADMLDAKEKTTVEYPAVIVEPKSHLESNSGVNKGADINTINKLRTSIEQKEIERQRVMMRKQNSSEISEDDSNKADIASILAARIRTKGELKGFTPTEVVKDTPPPPPVAPVEIPKDPIEPPADIEGTSAFDVMDWGNACNDFVDQLQTGKKRGRRKQAKMKSDDGNDTKKVDPYTNSSNTQGPDSLSTVPMEVLKNIEEQQFSNSSDEDKPLNLLRQQSTPECKDENSMGLNKGSETCSSAMKSGSVSERSSQSIRKKQRLVLEQKIAARIGTGSSSDTEPEDKPSPRARKRKLRTRSSLGMKESDKSNDRQEVKSEEDSSSESDEKEPKNISQLDGSSDSDNQDKSAAKKFRKTPVKGKSQPETKQKRLSRHEKHSEQSEHSETETRKSKSKSGGKRNKSKNSDSDGAKDETMTRSKRKLEMEKKISNSKVLRNDKIVQNVTVKKPKNVQEVASKQTNNKGLEKGKKKDESKNENLKRKNLESDCEQKQTKTRKCMTRSLSKVESSSSDNDEKAANAKNDRLRPRKSKGEETEKTPKRKNSKSEDIKPKVTKKTPEKASASQTKYPAGWEAQLYAFKKSLKIPARLINVSPNNHRYSTSLPDLDPQSSESEFSETSKASSFFIKTEETETEGSNSKKSGKRSIIDLLHQRMTPSLNKMMQKKKLQKELTRQPAKSNNELEQLPTPTVESSSSSKSNSTEKDEKVKRSIFDLSILKTRTRNEQKHMKHKEIIREIFCGEDRPSSAPPLGLDLETTFDQKFGQIMKKIDDIVASTSTSLNIKQEKLDETFVPPQDEETTDTVLNVNNDRDGDDRDLDTPSVNSERDMITPVSFKDMPKPTKRGRQARRKQSSGFDYIRKKKKPAPTNSDGTPVATKRRIAAVNYLQEKDENDISKEVKGWVLNKGVGECYLHKAARLGYLDVIAYCLFRIDMDVDTKDNAGYTALHEACSKGNLGIVRLLLQCGANHSQTALSGFRPLHEAVQNNYTEIARLLLAYGADPSLSTYSGQTPEMLAETEEMERFLSNYLKDVQGGVSPAWQLPHPWQQYDSDTEALDIFDGVSELFPEPISTTTTPVKTVAVKNCDSNLNNIIKDERIKYKSCSVVLNNIDHLKSLSPKALRKSLDNLEVKNQFNDVLPNMESDGEMFEFEESEYPLPPLYLLQDEGSDKWIMLTDLCNILKVKSKDAVLKQIDPNTPTSTLNKELVRELKITDFIEKATCLQLLCAGEKLNARASKVVLVRYNDAVKKLLNVQTIVLKF